MPKNSAAFTCPDCGATFVVDDAMRAALLQSGCVTCGSGIADEAFRQCDSGKRRQHL